MLTDSTVSTLGINLPPLDILYVLFGPYLVLNSFSPGWYSPNIEEKSAPVGRNVLETEGPILD